MISKFYDNHSKEVKKKPFVIYKQQINTYIMYSEVRKKEENPWHMYSFGGDFW